MTADKMTVTPLTRPHSLVLGTHNRKKCEELRQLLAPYGFEIRSLAEIRESIEVEETGTTFVENARLKAREQAMHLGSWTIGEDSGLCVPYLDNSPGVYSARYSGPGATDETNNRKLLEELAGVPVDSRHSLLCLHDCSVRFRGADLTGDRGTMLGTHLGGSSRSGGLWLRSAV